MNYPDYVFAPLNPDGHDIGDETIIIQPNTFFHCDFHLSLILKLPNELFELS